MKSYPLTGRRYLPPSLDTVIVKVAEKVVADTQPEPVVEEKKKPDEPKAPPK